MNRIYGFMKRLVSSSNVLIGTNVCSYRAVSILPIVSKIYEKEMVCQLLSPYISGFRKTHSCETVLIRMVEDNY